MRIGLWTCLFWSRTLLEETELNRAILSDATVSSMFVCIERLDFPNCYVYQLLSNMHKMSANDFTQCMDATLILTKSTHI